MTKKEKEIMKVALWKLARKFVRAEKDGKNEEYLNGYFEAMVTMYTSLDFSLKSGVDLTDLLVRIKNGETYDEIFN